MDRSAPIDATPAAASWAGPPLHERATALSELRLRMRTQPDFWVFAYGSLMWKPAFDAAEQRLARLWGHHRALQMHSRIDRGTHQRPGLVFALLPGGSCRGLVQRVPPAQREEVLEALWAREMVSGVYRPCWIHCQTAQGQVRALTFTLPRHSPSHAGLLSEAQLIDIFRHAHGRYGRTLDYLMQTAAALRELHIHDQHVQRLVALAHRHRLLPDGTGPAALRMATGQPAQRPDTLPTDSA